MSNKVELFLAAIDPFIQSNTVENTEKKVSGKDFISWGENNGYPQFLWGLYNDCATLQTIINGTSDYVVGDDVICKVKGFEKAINKAGDTIKDIVQRIAVDYILFGSFAVQVIRNVMGNVSEIYWVDINKLRSDEKNEVFFYSDDWAKSYGRVKYLVYPKFNPKDSNATSIFYYKGNKTRSTYGTPIWSAAVRNAMIENYITDYHLNEINNNFMTSKLISFNNGMPTDEVREEIERNLTEKFAGTGNAGRTMISFADSRDNAPEVISLATDNFADRYNTLAERNMEQIFTAFRATPVLFGIVTKNNGFSTTEYSDSFKLFNKTVVSPIQDAIIDCFDKIFGVTDSVVIAPFTITFDTNKE
jgi:hypothetical protein